MCISVGKLDYFGRPSIEHGATITDLLHMRRISDDKRSLADAQIAAVGQMELHSAGLLYTNEKKRTIAVVKLARLLQ